MIIKVRTFVLFFIFSLASGGAFAQITTPSHNEEVQLVDWLLELEKKYNLDFSYSDSLLGNFKVNYSANCESLSVCLQEISKLIPLKFESSDGKNYLVIPIRKNIAFKAIDKETNELVTALNIQLNTQPEKEIYAKNSILTIENVFPLDSVHIRSPFYQSIHFLGADLINLGGVLSLEQPINFLNEVVISGYLTKGVDSKLSDHSLQINMKSLGLFAGETDGDIFNVLKNIPGIRTPDGKPGSLNFRGSTFDQNLVYIDDIPIYHTGHFFGTISPYNPTAVSTIEIQRSTLPAKWGGRVGGLINMTTDTNIPNASDYQVLVNTLYAGATVKMPVVKDKLGISLSARTNYPDYRSSKLEALNTLNFQGSRVDPNAIGETNSLDKYNIEFNDFNGKLIYDISENHKATLSFINIANRFSYLLNSPNRNLLESQDINLDNWGITGKWEAKLSDRFKSSVALSKSSLRVFDFSVENENDVLRRFDKRINTIEDNRFIVETIFDINEKTRIEGGYTLTNHDTSFKEFIDEVTLDKQQNREANIHSFYASARHNWGSKFMATLGIHSDYYEPLNTLYVDPRVSLSFSATKAFFLKASAGVSHQFIQQKFKKDFDDFRLDNQFWELPRDKAEVIEGKQFMIGALYNVLGWLVDLEVYQRKTKNLTFQPSPGNDFIGSLEAIGGDLFLKKKWKFYETWVGYSLSKVTSNFDINSTAFFNQSHIFNLTGLVNLEKWNFAMTWQYSTGLPVEIPTSITSTIPYTNRFPAQHQLDFSATYTFWNNSKGGKGTVGLSMINIYDRENIINIFQDRPRENNLFRQAIGFAPNLQASFHF